MACEESAELREGTTDEIRTCRFELVFACRAGVYAVAFDPYRVSTDYVVFHITDHQDLRFIVSDSEAYQSFLDYLVLFAACFVCVCTGYVIKVFEYSVRFKCFDRVALEF